MAVKPAIGQAGVIGVGKVSAAAAQSSSAVLRGAAAVGSLGVKALSTPVGIGISVAGAADFCLEHCSSEPDTCSASPDVSLGSINAP